MKLFVNLQEPDELGSLVTISRNIEPVTLKQIDNDTNDQIEVERFNNQINWSASAEMLSFPLETVSSIGLVELVNGSEKFYGFCIEWESNGEKIRYRMVTVHQSKLRWLSDMAEEVSNLFEMPLENSAR